MKLFKKFFLLMFAVITVLSVAACQYDSDVIVIAEGDWDSNIFYNEMVKIIIEEGYDTEVEITQVGTQVMTLGLIDGDIDLNIETWAANMGTYEDDIAEGRYDELGTNFDDNYQGLYIPTYIQEANPGLVSVQDLVDYKALFPDPEITNWDPETDKAVVYGGPSGWGASKFYTAKFENEELYKDLVDNFEFRTIEATATLNATIASANDNEEAWVGYYWEPTDIMGIYDMVLLEDDIAFDSETGAGNLPTTPVTIVSTDGFKEDYPEIADFLSNMSTSSAVVNDVLAYKTQQGLDIQAVTVWWMQENVDMWSSWVTEDAATKINDALDAM
ncbi:hypothetical protein KHQ89_04115 [Mycoplasmatota bacterium]|nr:hypothetical protein KHQ89_04115 [Mycoplasmatota bacterium]